MSIFTKALINPVSLFEKKKGIFDLPGRIKEHKSVSQENRKQYNPDVKRIFLPFYKKKHFDIPFS